MPIENLEVGDKSQKEKGFRLTGNIKRVHRDLTEWPYNKVLTADTIAGYARDFIHFFFPGVMSFVNCEGMKD